MGCEAEGGGCFGGQELKRDDPHAHQVAAVNALVTLCYHCLHALCGGVVWLVWLVEWLVRCS